MSMTQEEAIELLRDTPIDIRSTREDDIHTLYATAQMMAIDALRPVSLEKADDDDPVSQRLVNMAKNVVRSHTLERIEEAWRGEWIAVREAVGGYKCSRCKAEAVLDCNDEFVFDNFCPRCGAAMTDEAVQMVMERLEVLHDKDV